MFKSFGLALLSIAVTGRTCPSTPRGKYTNTSSVSAVSGFECHGSVGSSTYKNGVFCKVKIDPKIEYCTQFGDNSCYFTEEFIGNNPPPSSQLNISSDECDSLAKCGQKECPDNNQAALAAGIALGGVIAIIIVVLVLTVTAVCLVYCCCFKVKKAEDKVLKVE